MDKICILASLLDGDIRISNDAFQLLESEDIDKKKSNIFNKSGVTKVISGVDMNASSDFS